MMINSRLFFLLLAFVTIFASCNKDDTDEKLADEEQQLSEYITKQQPDAKSIKTGLYIKKATEFPDAVQPKGGQYILINYTLKQLYTNTSEISSYEDYAGYMYYPIYQYGGPELWQLYNPLNGIYEALGQMREGESASVYLSSRYNVFTSGLDFISRVWQPRIVKVISDLGTYQQTLMTSALKYNISDPDVDTLKVKSSVDNNEYSIFYAVQDEGSGAELGNTTSDIKVKVKISYTLQENIIQNVTNNEEVSQTWSTYLSASQVLKKLKKGARVTIAMPYILHFGDEVVVNENTRQIVIPKGSVLVLEVNVES